MFHIFLYQANLIKFNKLVGQMDGEWKTMKSTVHSVRKECGSYEEELVLPTLAIVEHLVAAAAAASTVRRIVHTSSMAGVRDPRQAPANGRFYTAELDWNSVSARDGPWPEP